MKGAWNGFVDKAKDNTRRKKLYIVYRYDYFEKMLRKYFLII